MQRTIAIFTLAFLLPAVGWAAEPEPELAALKKSAVKYRPGTGDLTWREIPWYGEPSAVLEQARVEKRPLFVWLAGGRDRDGSPLERC